jgi:hypothetical protein
MPRARPPATILFVPHESEEQMRARSYGTSAVVAVAVAVGGACYVAPSLNALTEVAGPDV